VSITFGKKGETTAGQKGVNLGEERKGRFYWKNKWDLDLSTTRVSREETERPQERAFKKKKGVLTVF